MPKAKKKTKKKAKANAKKKSKLARKKVTKVTIKKSPKAKPKRASGRGKKSARKGGAQAPKRIPGKRIGSVTHYFPHVNAAVVKIEAGGLRAGDSLYFKGHTTDFQQVVDSMQLDHQPVQDAVAGHSIAVKMQERCRKGDVVYKLAA